jgi:hypothetical protein
MLESSETRKWSASGTNRGGYVALPFMINGGPGQAVDQGPGVDCADRLGKCSSNRDESFDPLIIHVLARKTSLPLCKTDTRHTRIPRLVML